MPALTKMNRGIEVCIAHGINMKFCSKCQATLAEKNKPSINDRILAVLKDGQWHTQRAIATAAGLEDREGYVDIGRDIRNMRMEAFGSHPIDRRQSPDDPMIYEYRYLTPDEAPAFWKERETRLPAAKLASKDEEIAFLKEYIAELESDLAALKAPLEVGQTVKISLAPEAAAKAS